MGVNSTNVKLLLFKFDILKFYLLLHNSFKKITNNLCRYTQGFFSKITYIILIFLILYENDI